MYIRTLVAYQTLSIQTKISSLYENKWDTPFQMSLYLKWALLQVSRLKNHSCIIYLLNNK